MARSSPAAGKLQRRDFATLSALDLARGLLRHSVDLASARPHANGVRIEDVSRLVGHSATGVTERVYRHQLRAVLDEGTAVMDGIFPLDGAG